MTTLKDKVIITIFEVLIGLFYGFLFSCAIMMNLDGFYRGVLNETLTSVLLTIDIAGWFIITVFSGEVIEQDFKS